MIHIRCFSGDWTNSSHGFVVGQFVDVVLVAPLTYVQVNLSASSCQMRSTHSVTTGLCVTFILR